QWRLRATNLVGVVAVPAGGGRAVTVRIAPKIPVARLLFLLGYSHGRWRTEQVPVDAEPHLLPAVARMFAHQAERSLRQGLLQGYREVEETALVMRGRVRHSEQVRRHHGRLVPLEITHDDYTTDIAENRLLRTAGEALLRLPGGVAGGVPAEVRGRLLRLRARLAEITPVP
ncbi:5-methylcytosine restriction system specificity protein McrC, partial [Saccharomonospora iraqiensis]|uniref:5-methylcytosine restriction system specificity protein McrC n=1 Tax=Saccharomonospora iraqiensis TaxID=52698 RepID=UPI000594CD9C